MSEWVDNKVFERAYASLGERERRFSYWHRKYTEAVRAGKDGLAQELLARAYVMPDGFFAFCRDVIGYNNKNYGVGVVDHFHGDICSLMTSTYRYRMLQACRGSFKSSIAVVAYALWLIARETALKGHCDIRILLGSEVLSLATSNLRDIRWHLESNERFIELYGDHKPSIKAGETKKKWGDSELMSAKRKRGGREATVEIMALGRERTGYHGEVIILDDIQAYRGTFSRQQLEKCWDLYRLCHSLLEPGGELSIVSTRWHYDDIYSRILKEDEDVGEFQIVIKPAEDENGNPTFPERFSREELDRIKARLGPYLYSCQYLLNPIPDENRIFVKEWVKFTEPSHYNKRENVSAYGGVDIAFETGERHCYSALTVALVDGAWNVYVVEAMRFRGTIGEVINRMYELNEKWGISRWGIGREDRRGLAYPLEREAFDRSEALNVVWVDVPRASKNEQIRRTLQPMFQAGKIWIPREARWLHHELMDFPLGQTDDGLDALERMVRASVPSNASTRVGGQTEEFDPQIQIKNKLAEAGAIVEDPVEEWEVAY